MIEKGHPQLSVRRQSELLRVNRNRLTPARPKVNAQDERILRHADAIHMKDPSFGARKIRRILFRDPGIRVGRRRLSRLMKLAGIRACYRRPRTSLPGKGHAIYPYLLGEGAVERPDQAWCSDITYIPMERGFCYLAAVMDWHSRAVLGWAVSTSMEASLCLEAFSMALQRTGRTPEIMNTDQGSQYTGEEWIKAMKSRGIRVSMDGKGRWIDNVFIERLWRSVKYEDVYLKAYRTPRELERGLGDWFERYNRYRPHDALEEETPWSVYAQSSRGGKEQVA